MASPTTDRRLGLVGNTAYKVPVTVVATANITQSGEQTIDGVAVKAINTANVPDRVLCVGMTDPTKNGLWDVQTSAWTRSYDANGNYDLVKGTQVYVAQGTVGAGLIYVLTTANPITVGTTALTWSQSLTSGFLALLASTAGASLIGWIRAATGAVATTVSAWLGWQPLSAFEFMTPAQIADVQAGTLLLDVSVPLQTWANAIAGKAGKLPPGKYKQTVALSLKDNTTIYGDGIGVSMLYTALDIEQINANAAGAYNVTFKDLGFYNTFPVSDVAGPTPTATPTSGTATLTGVSSIVGLAKGLRITGTGIPAGTYIRKFVAGTIYMCNSAGVAVNATSSPGPVVVSTFFRQGQTKFHIYAFNAGHWVFDNCYFKSNFVDTDYSPNNHAGIRFDRTSGASYFINEVHNCWVDHGQILMGTSDSNVKNCHVWANPFDYAVGIAAPGVQVEGCNTSAGQISAIYIKASVTELSGAALATIVGNNIDCGNIFYAGYGVFADTPLALTIVGNRINQCNKGGIYTKDAAVVTMTGNTFLDNNQDGLGYSDIETEGVAAQPTGLNYTGNTFYQSGSKAPTIGFAIREINSGFAPANCSYGHNVITGGGNYTNSAFSIATTVASGQYPKVVGNAGGGTETESIGNAITNKYTGSLTGCTTVPTADVQWSRQGDLISLRLPIVFNATSNSSACTITGMPAAIRPAVQCGGTIILTDNGVNALGTANIAPSGVITLLTNTASGGFTAANAKGVFIGNVTYPLQG